MLKRQVATRGVTYVEVLVVIGIILVVIAFLFPLQTHTREPSHRVRCSSNLRQIGQAILLYSNENRGAYPRTIYDPDQPLTWGTPTVKKEHPTTNPFGDAEDRPAANDMTAALYLLIRTQDITTEVFTCPSSNAEKLDFGTGDATSLMNWGRKGAPLDLNKYLSYSYAVPYPAREAEKRGYKSNNSLTAEFAVAADINPGLAITGGSPNGVITSTSSLSAMKGGNSPNHDQDGQSVLFGDGHVEFVNNPFQGVQRDNIYTYRTDPNPAAPKSVQGKAVGPVESLTIDMNAIDPEDSFLLPTDD